MIKHGHGKAVQERRSRNAKRAANSEYIGALSTGTGRAFTRQLPSAQLKASSPRLQAAAHQLVVAGSTLPCGPCASCQIE